MILDTLVRVNFVGSDLVFYETKVVFEKWFNLETYNREKLVATYYISDLLTNCDVEHLNALIILLGDFMHTPDELYKDIHSGHVVKKEDIELLKLCKEEYAKLASIVTSCPEYVVAVTTARCAYKHSASLYGTYLMATLLYGQKINTEHVGFNTGIIGYINDLLPEKMRGVGKGRPVHLFGAYLLFAEAIIKKHLSKDLLDIIAETNVDFGLSLVRSDKKLFDLISIYFE